MSMPPRPPGEEGPRATSVHPAETRGFFEPDRGPSRGPDGDDRDQPQQEEYETLVLGPHGQAEPPPPYLPPSTDAPPPGPDAPERDRIWPHLLWEMVLLAACVVLAVLVALDENGSLTGAAGRSLLMQAAVLVLLASAMALSLRGAVPNLAVGAVAAGAGALTAYLRGEYDWNTAGALGLALLGGLLVGLALALVVVVLHVPAWATTLGAAFALTGLAFGLLGPGQRVVRDGPDVADSAWLWLALAALGSVVGGALLAVGPFRRLLGATRSAKDPGRRPGVAGAFGATIALVFSSGLAAAAGVLQVYYLRGAFPEAAAGLTTAALAAALIGGVSVFGRRGGIFGTVLGAVLLVLVQRNLVLGDVDAWVNTVVIGGAVVVGLLVNRMLEALGRRRPKQPSGNAPAPQGHYPQDSPYGPPGSPAGR